MSAWDRLRKEARIIQEKIQQANGDRVASVHQRVKEHLQSGRIDHLIEWIEEQENEDLRVMHIVYAIQLLAERNAFSSMRRLAHLVRIPALRVNVFFSLLEQTDDKTDLVTLRHELSQALDVVERRGAAEGFVLTYSLMLAQKSIELFQKTGEAADLRYAERCAAFFFEIDEPQFAAQFQIEVADLRCDAGAYVTAVQYLIHVQDPNALHVQSQALAASIERHKGKREMLRALEEIQTVLWAVSKRAKTLGQA
jgi:hypothetical protein